MFNHMEISKNRFPFQSIELSTSSPLTGRHHIRRVSSYPSPLPEGARASKNIQRIGGFNGLVDGKNLRENHRFAYQRSKHPSPPKIWWHASTHGNILFIAKSDVATDLRKRSVGWDNHQIQIINAKLERGIRLIKVGVRSIMIMSGLPHQLWPKAIKYFYTAHIFSTKTQIHPNEIDKSKIKKSTQPGDIHFNPSFGTNNFG